MAAVVLGTFLKFCMGNYAKKFLSNQISADITNIVIFWKSPENYFHVFVVLSINHTGELGLDIFFLGWYMIIQIFSSHSLTYKFYKCTAAIL